MHIKTLTIQGFKSYRDQVSLEEFSPGHNVVLGRNGAGKSNFFAAIRFVLSDAYTSLSREERQTLLHEGSSTTQTMSAYVEIIFSNDDGRFPTGREEVVIRRTIGLKKDEYSLDRKSCSKADVMNLLESAGFSRSNPYYIVPQGRITSLTNAKDHERLALLKEVAGTKVYESRRLESERILEETDSKRSKISQLLDYINERLQSLEEEKEELKQFQSNDKERRCLEYALFSRDLSEITNTMEELEEEHEAAGWREREGREKAVGREGKIKELEGKIKESRAEQSLHSTNRKTLDAEMAQLIQAKTEVDCLLEDLKASESMSGTQRGSLEKEIDTIKRDIREKEVELMELDPLWEESRLKEARERQELDVANARLQSLYSKQGRLAQFSSTAERDSFLKKEIKSLEQFLSTQSKGLKELKTDVEEVKSRVEELEGQEEGLRETLNSRSGQLRELEGKVNALKDEKAAKGERRKELWREDAKLETTLGHARDELRAAERSLGGMMDKDTSAGLHAVDKIAEKLKLSGVYGPLYRLFTVNNRVYNTPVELTAGTSLFHIVVDTDETASRVLAEMLKDKIGRVTFMPLNRLKPKAMIYPEADEVSPLIQQLTYDPKFEKAFQQVFGKTCVCGNLAIAAKYARSHDLNTITVEGDKVDRKGALTGGFHDTKRSRMEAVNNYRHWKGRFQEEVEKSATLKLEIAPLEQEITRLTGEIQITSSQRMRLLESREPVSRELAIVQREKEGLKERLAKELAEIADLETEIGNSKVQIKAFQDEIGAPLSGSLNPRERKEMQDLVKQVDVLKTSLIQTQAEASEYHRRKSLLEIELNENLRRKRNELEGRIEMLLDAPLGENEDATNIDTKTRELDALNASIDRLRRELQEEEAAIEELATSIAAHQKELEKELQAQREDARALSKQQKLAERYLAKRQMLSARKEECSRSIRDLGVLPEEAFEKYIKDKPEKLLKKLETVNANLKKYGHVNKKAFEQYNNFTKQREQLRKRGEELDVSQRSIQDLIATLDQRKDEAIERTFKQVSKYFEEVFENLVPAGRGRLIMQKSVDPETQDTEMDEEGAGAVDRYTGVAIKVSFNSKVDEGLRIQQLSGGQKSLVALATVFAIQKCDPAPFYLFDEIDANLDAQYRTAVASMIHELSETAQFITTTFRPEMLQQADKFYGVLFDNQKVSTIRSITRQDAVEFIEHETAVQ